MKRILVLVMAVSSLFSVMFTAQAIAASDCGSLEQLSKKTEAEMNRVVDTIDAIQKTTSRIERNNLAFALDFDADILRDKTDRLVMAAQCVLEESHMAFDDVDEDANDLIEEEYQMRRSLVFSDKLNTASDKAAMLNGLKAIQFAKKALALAKEAGKNL